MSVPPRMEDLLDDFHNGSSATEEPAENPADQGYPEPKFRRPPNAFLLWSNTRRKELQEMCPGLKGSRMAQIIGNEWKALPVAAKNIFFEKAKEKLEDFHHCHPDYQFRRGPNKKRRQSKPRNYPNGRNVHPPANILPKPNVCDELTPSTNLDKNEHTLNISLLGENSYWGGPALASVAPLTTYLFPTQADLLPPGMDIFEISPSDSAHNFVTTAAAAPGGDVDDFFSIGGHHVFAELDPTWGAVADGPEALQKPLADAQDAGLISSLESSALSFSDRGDHPDDDLVIMSSCHWLGRDQWSGRQSQNFRPQVRRSSAPTVLCTTPTSTPKHSQGPAPPSRRHTTHALSPPTASCFAPPSIGPRVPQHEYKSECECCTAPRASQSAAPHHIHPIPPRGASPGGRHSHSIAQAVPKDATRRVREVWQSQSRSAGGAARRTEDRFQASVAQHVATASGSAAPFCSPSVVSHGHAAPFVQLVRPPQPISYCQSVSHVSTVSHGGQMSDGQHVQPLEVGEQELGKRNANLSFQGMRIAQDVGQVAQVRLVDFPIRTPKSSHAHQHVEPVSHARHATQLNISRPTNHADVSHGGLVPLRPAQPISAQSGRSVHPSSHPRCVSHASLISSSPFDAQSEATCHPGPTEPMTHTGITGRSASHDDVTRVVGTDPMSICQPVNRSHSVRPAQNSDPHHSFGAISHSLSESAGLVPTSPLRLGDGDAACEAPVFLGQWGDMLWGYRRLTCSNDGWWYLGPIGK